MSRLAILILAFTLSACTSQPEYASFKGMSAGSAIAVESFDGITEAGAPASKVGELAVRGAGTGAAVGTQTGLAFGEALTGDCGEFIVVCLGLLPVFSLAGVISGVIVGSTAGLIEDMPYQSTEAMQELVSAYFVEAPPNEVFSQTFTEAASTSWIIDPEADSKVTVAVIGVRPKKVNSKTLAFEVTTAMSVRYAAAKSPTKPYQFTTTTQGYSVEEWIDGGRALYSEEVGKTYIESAGVFMALLRRPPRQ